MSEEQRSSNSGYESVERIRRSHRNARPDAAENPAWANCHLDCGVLLTEIERLRAELAAATQRADHWYDVATERDQFRLQAEAERDRLRAELADAQALISSLRPYQAQYDQLHADLKKLGDPLALEKLMQERDRLRKFLTDERERHMAYIRGSSHWSDCHKVHRECARVRDIDAALAAGEGK